MRLKPMNKKAHDISLITWSVLIEKILANIIIKEETNEKKLIIEGN
jgi:hypothetical protein